MQDTVSLAFEYAHSGRFESYRQIENRLRLHDRHRNVKSKLGTVKEILNDICKQDRVVHNT